MKPVQALPASKGAEGKWVVRITSLEGDKLLSTIEGKTEAEASDGAGAYVVSKKWNMVTVSKKKRVKGLVDMTLSEILAATKENFHMVIAWKLTGGEAILRGVNYKMYDCTRGRIGFIVSGYLT